MAVEAHHARDAPVHPELDAAPAHAEPRGWAPVRGVRAAFILFSRLPVGGFPYRARDWHWAPAHLPLVGGVVGCAAAAVFVAGGWLGLGPLLRATLTLATGIWLTGALHEDGLADSADGLGGGSEPARVLAIMKDSRIGSYGAVALVLTLLARAAALSELPDSAWFAIVGVHVAARVPPVWLMWALPYVNDRADARNHGLFETRAVHVGAALAWSGAMAALGVGFGWLRWPALLALALVPLALIPPLKRFFRRRVGGVTGDLLGAAEQLAEVAAWMAVTAALAARAQLA